MSRAGERLPALTHRHGFVRTWGLRGLGRSPDRVPALQSSRYNEITVLHATAYACNVKVCSHGNAGDATIKALTSPGKGKGANAALQK